MVHMVARKGYIRQKHVFLKQEFRRQTAAVIDYSAPFIDYSALFSKK